MKIGDIVKYRYPRFEANPESDTGIIISVNFEGGTLKVLDMQGQVDWFITSYCEVISEHEAKS